MEDMFKPVGESRLLSQRVESVIEEAIRSRKLKPGTKLPTEHELCAQFDVSRTALREALRMLSARGLVTIEKGRGMFVRQPSADTVTDSLQLYLTMMGMRGSAKELVYARQVIEPPVAELAATNQDEDLINEIGKAIEEMRECEGHFAELADLDLTFHRLVARASGSMLLPLLLEPIHALMQRIVPSVYETVAEAKEITLEWHEEIYFAIRDGRPEAAHGAMARHLEVSEEHVNRIWTADGSDGAHVGAPLSESPLD